MDARRGGLRVLCYSAAMDHADLRRRLLLAIGVVALPVAAHAFDSAEDAEVKHTVCIQGDFDTGCPDSADVERLREGDCPAVPEPGPGTLTNGVCCYEVVQGTCGMGCSCAHGRPMLRESRPLLAGLATTRWQDASLARPDLSGLNTLERGRLARFWASVGAHEHSSIAAFHRVALELLAHGAPEKLLAASQRAALDEARHARHAFTFASHFAGATIGPAALPLGATVDIATTLEARAVRTVREGCVEETMSLLAAERMLAESRDPAVRHVLSALVRDEKRHVDLAWRTVRWAIDSGGRTVCDAVAVAFAEARAPVPTDAEPLSPRLAAWGAISDERLCHAAAAGLHALIRPVAAQLSA